MSAAPHWSDRAEVERTNCRHAAAARLTRIRGSDGPGKALSEHGAPNQAVASQHRRPMLACLRAGDQLRNRQRRKDGADILVDEVWQMRLAGFVEIRCRERLCDGC